MVRENRRAVRVLRSSATSGAGGNSRRPLSRQLMSPAPAETTMRTEVAFAPNSEFGGSMRRRELVCLQREARCASTAASGNAPHNCTIAGDCRANDGRYDRGRPTYVNSARMPTVAVRMEPVKFFLWPVARACSVCAWQSNTHERSSSCTPFPEVVPVI
jgi:hypothetical protein